jgi:hypothetical protein
MDECGDVRDPRALSVAARVSRLLCAGLLMGSCGPVKSPWGARFHQSLLLYITATRA